MAKYNNYAGGLTNTEQEIIYVYMYTYVYKSYVIL